MNKKYLLKLKMPTASKKMIDAAKEEKQVEVKRYGGGKYYNYQKYAYLSASVENEILKVAIFCRKRLVAGVMTPMYVVYISKAENDWITYDLEEEKWRTAKIDNLEIASGYYGWGLDSKQNWQTEKDRELVNKYFGTGINREIRAAVLDFQAGIRKENLIRKHRNEQEQIDEVMNEVPELPKDFDSWIVEKAFVKHEYMFYKRERPYKVADCLCTHCGNWTYAPTKPEHNKMVKCPVCKTKVRYKSWQKQQTVQDEICVGILQKLKDASGYILRGFQCKVKRRFDKGWENYELFKYEDIRVRLDDNFIEREYFEYGEWNYTGVIRWCHTSRRSQWSGWYGNKTFGNAIMYTRNLKRVLKDTAIEHCKVAKYMSKDTGEKVAPAVILATLNRYPMVEYLEKQRFYRFVEEIMSGKMRSGMINNNANNLKDALKINKQRMDRLRRLDGGWKTLKALQHEETKGEKITDEQLRYIEEECIDIYELECARTLMSVSRMINYLRHQSEINHMDFRQTKRLYEDYLDMAAERGLDLTDEIVCHNNRMREFHDKYLEEKNKAAAIERDRIVNERFAQIKKDYKQNTKHFGYETDEYTILVPKCASDITQEGRKQHHCVGATDGYMKKMTEHTTFILFMRHKKQPEIPYYTLEVTWDGKIIQNYAAYDRKPDKEVVEKFLAMWSTVIKKRLLEEQKNVKVAAVV